MDYTAAKIFILKQLEEKLSDKLHYHGKHHTLDVLGATIELCKAEKIPPYETLLLKTASLYHDAGFLIDRENHEQHGCELARKYLPSFRYIPEEIEKICSMILATKIPQSPCNRLEEILCDADLDYLGREDFYSIADSLFQELQQFGVVNDRQTWDEIQINFLKKHSFFTPTNIKRRLLKKQLYLEELQRKLKKGPGKATNP